MEFQYPVCRQNGHYDESTSCATNPRGFICTNIMEVGPKAIIGRCFRAYFHAGTVDVPSVKYSLH